MKVRIGLEKSDLEDCKGLVCERCEPRVTADTVVAVSQGRER